MSRAHCVENHLEARLEHLGYHILVAYAYIFEVERFGVSGLGTAPSPLGAYVAIGILDKVEHVGHIGRHILHRYSVLLAEQFERAARGVVAGAGILAGNTGRKHGQRLSPYILAEKEILVVPESARLVVAP